MRGNIYQSNTNKNNGIASCREDAITTKIQETHGEQATRLHHAWQQKTIYTRPAIEPPMS